MAETGQPQLPTEASRGWRILRIVGTTLSLVLLVWLLARQDWGALLAGLRSIPPTSVVLALLLLATRHLAFALRWSFLLRAQEIRVDFWTLVKLQYASLFASNFLPTTVGGDVARLAGVLSRTQAKVAGAASIMVDRAIGAFGMLFVLPFSWPLLSSTLSGLAPIGALSAGRLGFVRRFVDRLWSALRLWAGKPEALVRALGATWFGVLCYLLAVWVIASGLGMPISLRDVASATGLTYFISLIPISINAYGLREVSMVLFYTELGGTPEQSAALALLTRMVLVAISLPGALSLSGVIRARASEGAS